MKVKKYIAPTMAEASEKIRQDLGKDALILNSKVVYQGGFLGFFKKKNIEVIAALDTDRTVTAKKRLKETPIKKEKKQNDSHQLLNEMQELKTLVTALKTTVTDTSQYPETLQKIYDGLVNQEVQEEKIQSWIEKLLEQNETIKNKPYEAVEEAMKELILQEIINYSFEGLSFDKKYITVLGPTGVGKTTTIAKLAAVCSLQKQKKVAMITTDTYRIAAVEQLKIYAQILNVPLEVAYNLDDFKRAKEKFQYHDLVFIDTAGRNFRDSHYVSELKKLLDFNEEIEAYLVLALTSKRKDMMEVYHQFQKELMIDRVIFTKLDETSTMGELFNFMSMYSRGISYVTTGQNVPDDLIKVTPHYLVEQLFNEGQK